MKFMFSTTTLRKLGDNKVVGGVPPTHTEQPSNPAASCRNTYCTC